MSKPIFVLTVYAVALSALLAQEVHVTLAQDSEEEEVEMLDVFEVPGTAIQPEARQQHFPTPTTETLRPFPDQNLLNIPSSIEIHRPYPLVSRTVMDPTGKIRGIRTSVKPIKAPRPSYPRFAREQGWEGTAVLRVTIDDDGKVSAVTSQKSSGFSILDESALHTVKQWRFVPAKNGEFAVRSVVDIPIRFDLDQSP